MSADRRAQLVGPVTLAAFVLTTGLALMLLLPSSRELEDLSTEGNPSELSLRHLQALIEANPSDQHLRILLAKQQFVVGDLDGVEEALAPMLGGGDRLAVDARILHAKVLLTRCLAVDPKDPLRAQCVLGVGRTLRALLGDPLERAELEELARSALGVGDPRLAADALERAGRMPPPSADLLAEAARWSRAAGDDARASRLYSDAAHAALEPKRRRELALLAIDAAASSGDPEGAYRLAEQLLKELPKDGEVLERVVKLATATGRNRRSRDVGRTLVETVSPNDAASVATQIDRELAAGDLEGALPWLLRLAQLRPADRLVHARLAQLGEWTQRPRLAYDEYTWLVAHDHFGLFLDRAIAYARMLHDGPALVAFLRKRLELGRLNEPDVLEVAKGYEEVGDPEEAARFLRQVFAKKFATRNLLKRLALLEESRGDRQAALRAWENMGSLTPAEAVHVAQLLRRLDRAEDALETLGHVLEPPAPSAVEYWTLVADLARELGDDARAVAALERLHQNGLRQEQTLAQLAALYQRAGRDREAARVMLDAYALTGSAPWLLDAVELLSLAEDNERALVILDKAAQAKPALLHLAPFWERKASVFHRQGRVTQACGAYDVALRIAPASATAFASALGCAMEVDDRVALERYVVATRKQIQGTPDLWGTYGLALVRVGHVREGIVYLTRVVRASPSDYGWMLELSRAYDAAGDRAHAYRLRKRALAVLWPRALQALRRPEGDAKGTRVLVARAILSREIEGVPVAYRWLASMMPKDKGAKADADVADLAVSFYLADRNADVARSALLAQRAAGSRAERISSRGNRMALALLENDASTIERLLAEPELPRSVRIEGLVRTGHETEAYRLTGEVDPEVEPDSDSSYRSLRADLASRVAPTAAAAFTFDGFGPLEAWGPRAIVALQVARARFEAEVRYAELRNGLAVLPVIQGRELTAMGEIQLKYARNDTRFAAGANLRPSGVLPFVTLSHERQLGDAVKAAASLAVHEVPTDTLILRLVGVRDALATSGSIGLTGRDRLEVRVGAFRESTVYHDFLGWGGTGSVSVVHRFLQGPNVEAVLVGQGILRDRSGGAQAALVRMGSVDPDPTLLLPAGAFTAAAGLQVAQGDWTTPWGRTGFPRYTASLTAGWLLPFNEPSLEARGGLGFRVFGEDSLGGSAYVSTGLTGGAGQLFRGFVVQYSRGL